MRIRPIASLLLVALVLAGCVSWFPGRVSKGVARLSVRNAGAILKAVQADTRCGFGSDVQPAITGEVGDLGTAVWTVTDCELSFEQHELETDCLGDLTTVEGTARITATRTVRGWITGNPETPVVPQTEDAVEISFSAELAGFAVKTTAGPEYLRIKSGTLSVVAQPRMALEQASGACAVATSDVRFAEIAYQDAELYVSSPDQSFDVPVPRSSFGAQAGVGADGLENELWGEVTVWDDTKSVNGALDPDYEADIYRDSYTCLHDYALPISRECGLERKLGNGAARLLIRSFGMVGKVLDEDDGCGFGSLSGLVPDEIDGIPLLDDEVEATWRVSGCTLGGEQPEAVYTDCAGTETLMSGTATATATKVVVGEVAAGNPPIVPKGRRKASVEVGELRVENLVIREQGTDVLNAYAVIESGTLRGQVLPVTGEAASDPGSYYIKTPVAGFAGLAVSDAVIVVHTEGKAFRIRVASALLDGFNGSYQADTNWISGTISVDGLEVEVEGRLDEEYDQQSFDEAYRCEDNLMAPVPAGS